ncbi:MAG: PrsW family glutamic-type intramembrane protease [Leptolinea sp.]
MNFTSKIHLPSLGMLLLSGGGALLAGTSAAALSLVGVMIWLGKVSAGTGAQAFFSFGWIAAVQFLLLLPSTILAGMRLTGATMPEWDINKAYWVSVGSLALVPAAIGAGAWLTRNARMAELLLPLIQLVVIGVPLAWLMFLGTRGFINGTSQRGWGIFSFSTMVSIPIILVAELFLLAGILLVSVLWLQISSPDLVRQLGNTVQRLANTDLETEAILRILRPYLNQPVVLVGGFAITAGIIPLMEEMLKPLALWFFAPRPLTAREGFIAGLICGASFALLESLGALANPPMETWSVVAIGRIGTGILHTTTSGLVGWGLGSAWSEGKYGRLVAAYAAAVCFHGLWNIFALLMGFGSITQFLGLNAGILDGFIQISPVILILLSGFMISIVRRANTLLRAAG